MSVLLATEAADITVEAGGMQFAVTTTRGRLAPTSIRMFPPSTCDVMIGHSAQTHTCAGRTLAD